MLYRTQIIHIFIVIYLVVWKREVRIYKPNPLHYVERCVDDSSANYKLGNVINLAHFNSIMNSNFFK